MIIYTLSRPLSALNVLLNLTYLSDCLGTKILFWVMKKKAYMHEVDGKSISATKKGDEGNK